MKLDNRGIHVSIVVVMLFQVCSLFIREFVRLKLGQSGMSDAEAKHLSALVGFVVLGILMWPILRETWPALRPLFCKPPKIGLTVLAAFGIGAMLWLINAIVLLWMATLAWPGQINNSAVAEPVFSFACENPEILILAIPVISLFTPIIEETTNRGLLLHTLLPKGKWFAVVVSAVLFMVMHTGETYPTAFLFGVIAAIQILTWGNIWGVIVTHGAFNLFVTIDQVCLGAYWIPGNVTWNLGSPMQTSTAMLLSAILGVYWLLKTPKDWAARSVEPPRL